MSSTSTEDISRRVCVVGYVRTVGLVWTLFVRSRAFSRVGAIILAFSFAVHLGLSRTLANYNLRARFHALAVLAFEESFGANYVIFDGRAV